MNFTSFPLFASLKWTCLMSYIKTLMFKKPSKFKRGQNIWLPILLSLKLPPKKPPTQISLSGWEWSILIILGLPLLSYYCCFVVCLVLVVSLSFYESVCILFMGFIFSYYVCVVLLWDCKNWDLEYNKCFYFNFSIPAIRISIIKDVLISIIIYGWICTMNKEPNRSETFTGLKKDICIVFLNLFLFRFNYYFRCRMTINKW